MAGRTRNEEQVDVEEEVGIRDVFLWSATRLWGFWALSCVLTSWLLREPLMLRQSWHEFVFFLWSLTPETCAVMSAGGAMSVFLLLLCEKWCYRNYECSFVESVFSGQVFRGLQRRRSKLSADYKVWRNPLCLFRGSEYNRYVWVMHQLPLTELDRKLTAQDQEVLFVCSSDDNEKNTANSIMAMAWRQHCSEERIRLANEALEKDPSSPAALLMLAEEDSPSILEAEARLRQAMKTLEQGSRPVCSGPVVIASKLQQNAASRNKALLVYIKWRLGMCARRLGRLKEAVRLFKAVARDCPYLSAHENLIEVLLEMRSYSDVQQVLSKYDDLGLPKSAVICYTAVLLRTRAVGESLLQVDYVNRNFSPAEVELISSVSRAAEFNPLVPPYLLEQRSLVLPAEHIVKRGDSEAVAYAFYHLRHWKRMDSALELLKFSWQTTFLELARPTEEGRYFHPYPSNTVDGDLQLMPAHHKVSTHPFKHIPFPVAISSVFCAIFVALFILLHFFPVAITNLLHLALLYIQIPLEYINEQLRNNIPSMWLILTRG